ncbi:hypothetical protein FKM82_012465 [Ascaphus truei]
MLPKHPYNITSQQLRLCIDYINSSSPFFICILGHTYGEFLPENHCPTGSPDQSDLSILSQVEQNVIVAANSGYPWLLEAGNKECSLTELEIIQAAFLRDAEFQYFYFRYYLYIEEKLQEAAEHERETILSTLASTDEYEESRIWELKIRIVDKGLPVRFF